MIRSRFIDISLYQLRQYRQQFPIASYARHSKIHAILPHYRHEYKIMLSFY